MTNFTLNKLNNRSNDGFINRWISYIADEKKRANTLLGYDK